MMPWSAKLGVLNRYITDLGAYVGLDDAARLRDHYRIERLLQLLCEAAADIALQFPKQDAGTLPASDREIFSGLANKERMPEALATELIAACGMRNLPMRAAIYGLESRISDQVAEEHGNTNAYEAREHAAETLKSKKAFRTLKRVRNALAHGARPEIDDVTQMVCNRKALANTLRDLLRALS